ncbi:MAG: hypothetical protein WCY12_05110 [Candidatus Omnitrophota bacterium]
MFKKRKDAGQERRKFIRLDTVFPVHFQLLSQDKCKELSAKEIGFTNNIGKGGICLCVHNLKPEQAILIMAKQAKLGLEIELPIIRKPVAAKAAIAWVQEFKEQPGKYLIGLSYEDIDPLQNKKVFRYARAKKMFAPLLFSIITVLAVAFSLNAYVSMKLINGNKALVNQLINIVQESSVAKQQIKKIVKESQDLQSKLQALQLGLSELEVEKKKINRKMTLAQQQSSKRQQEYDKKIEQLTKEKLGLQERLIVLQNKEGLITAELLSIDQKKATLEKANLDKMYQWLKVHQSGGTGLVMSFEGDSDVAGWAFVYDQSLVIQAFVMFSDFERAKKNLRFFAKDAKTSQGLYYNAYYVNDGNPSEYTIHCGPNIWLGMAALQYAIKANDNEFLGMAEHIANAIINIQHEDKDGGIRGGPTVTWFSTEHNLDAYAFFVMLYKITGNSKYDVAAQKTLNWLVQHTYDRQELPIKRGKGDSTIATDTYAWSIAAIGPAMLNSVGMNPDRIIEFAENNCSVEVDFVRPEGRTVRVKGFDFAPQRHVSRGGVCSPEWTAQMVMAFKIMTEYYFKQGMNAKAHSYEHKSDDTLAELANMVISSPSPSGQGESCLPYATQESVDTGHGWMTPKGKSTCSVAGTAYTIFAYYGYNPLQLQE